MGGNTGNMGSASPSGSGSSAPSGGKGSASPVQPYQGGQQATPTSGMLDWSSPNSDPSPFAQQSQQQNAGSFGFGQTAQSNQQYIQSPQQSGIQGLFGGYGKGGGGSMPNPYQQGGFGGVNQPQALPNQQQSIPNPARDDGMVGPGYQQQQTQQQTQPMYRTTEARWEEPQPYQAPDPSQQGFLGMNPNQQGIQQATQNFTQQQSQQAPVQQPSNMFYNMSAADIDKFNSQPRGQSALAAPAALDSGMVGRNQQVLTPEQTAAMQQASMKKGGTVK